MFMHSHAYVLTIFYILLYYVVGAFLIVSLSLLLSLFLALVCSMTHKRKSTPSRNPLHSRASSSSPSDPTPSHVKFHDEKAQPKFSENFSRRGIHSERQVIMSYFSDTDLPTVIYSRGLGVTVWHPGHVPFHAHTRVLLQYAHTVSKDELSSLFCETPSSWGDRQNTPCSGFAKGPRFLNMVMTFIFHPLSHYNTITEPRVWFLLSLLKDISIDFHSQFILSLIDVYRDTMTRDMLIFSSAITWILHHISVSFPASPHFLVIGAINRATIRRSEAQLWPRRSWT